MTSRSVARMILMNIGGRDNVVSVEYCSTRLRLEVRNERVADIVRLKDERGIIGAYKSGEKYQVITRMKPERLYKAFKKIGV